MTYLFLKGAGHEPAELTEAVVDPVSTPFLDNLIKNKTHIRLASLFAEYLCTWRYLQASSTGSTTKKQTRSTYSSTPLPRLHLSGRGWRHGAKRRAHVPEEEKT